MLAKPWSSDRSSDTLILVHDSCRDRAAPQNEPYVRPSAETIEGVLLARTTPGCYQGAYPPHIHMYAPKPGYRRTGTLPGVYRSHSMHGGKLKPPLVLSAYCRIINQTLLPKVLRF